MAKAKKKERTAKQKAATKKMLAANKAKRAGSAKPKAKPKKKKPKAKPAAAVASAKKKARKSSVGGKGKAKMAKKKSSKRGKRGAVGMRGFMREAKGIAMGAVAGGTAATALDVLLGWDKTPEMMKTPVGNVVTRTVGSFALGMATAAATKNRGLGRDLAMVSLGAMVNSVERGMVKKYAPDMPLGELADLSDALGYGGGVSEEEIAGLAAMVDGDVQGDADAIDYDGDGEDFAYVDEMLDGLNGRTAFIQ